MNVPERYRVEPIGHSEVVEWIRSKHYARRMPGAVMHAFGLYEGHTLVGVVTFGTPPRHLNRGYGLFGGEWEVDTYELNRLVVHKLPPNALSYFVANALNSLPPPCVVVSYADPNAGHHGYIYQATNWIYTGRTTTHVKFIGPDGKEIHARTMVSRYGSASTENLPEGVTLGEVEGKYRYLYFVGSKRWKRLARKKMVYEEQPYPKGDNERYDDSHQPTVQLTLFGGGDPDTDS